VETGLKIHRMVKMRKQFNILGGECIRTRAQPSMKGTEWSASKTV
jgi:hypothetical protein